MRRPTPKSDAAEKVEKAPGPPPVITATDGAASVEAVVKQMQTAALAGKGAQVLSVIYPTDRPTYGQGVAMALAFLPMASMDNPTAGEQVQKELDAFFAKYQLKPPFMRDPDDLFKGVDLPAFISGAMAFLKSHAKKGDPVATLPVPSGKPEDVKITGDDGGGDDGRQGGQVRPDQREVVHPPRVVPPSRRSPRSRGRARYWSPAGRVPGRACGPCGRSPDRCDGTIHVFCPPAPAAK